MIDKIEITKTEHDRLLKLGEPVEIEAKYYFLLNKKENKKRKKRIVKRSPEDMIALSKDHEKILKRIPNRYQMKAKTAYAFLKNGTVSSRDLSHAMVKADGNINQAQASYYIGLLINHEYLINTTTGA